LFGTFGDKVLAQGFPIEFRTDLDGGEKIKLT
jgi:hypothetical protein